LSSSDVFCSGEHGGHGEARRRPRDVFHVGVVHGRSRMPRAVDANVEVSARRWE
jgi:hypothetical protein